MEKHQSAQEVEEQIQQIRAKMESKFLELGKEIYESTERDIHEINLLSDEIIRLKSTIKTDESDCEP